MDIRKLFFALPAALALLVGMTSCDDMIYDDFEDCPRGVYVNFYSQTECADEASYPAEVSQLNIYAFDSENILRSIQVLDNVKVAPDFEQLVSLKEEGLHSILAWGNIDGHYTLEDVVVGQTSKEQILMRLHQDGKMGADLTDATLWFGQSPAFTLGKMEDGAPQYIRTRANLREYTNRITVTVDSVPNPADYQIRLASSNGSYHMDGQVAKSDSTYYPGETKVVADSTCRAFFTTLKLESGHENTLIVENKTTGKEMFRSDLVGLILTSQYASNINLRCLNDFDVRLVAHHCNCPDDTYMIVEVWVNEWLIHSFDITL